jgi:hypothetical protein
MVEEVDVSDELERLQEIYQMNLDPLKIAQKSNLNALIYHFEKFLDSHRRYEDTKNDLLKLNSKLQKLTGEEENGHS